MPLSSVLRHGTTAVLEIMPEPAARELAETLVAFANSEGGTVLIGVTQQGEVTGSLLLEDVDSLLRAAQNECRPPVQTDWEKFEDRAGIAVAIRVPRSSELHSLSDGRVLIRTSTGNQPLDGGKIGQLAATKTSGDLEGEIVAGATRADLDEDVIHDYIKHRTERLGRDLGRSEDELLRSIGALSAHGEPTVAGVLLFGKEPQFYLPQSGLTYVRFSGTEPHGPGGQAGYIRREDLNGALARVIESTWTLLLQEIRGEAVVRGLQREDRLIYPKSAVREALVNAVCHRDYRPSGRRVEVRQFDDRLELSSPGGLPGYITLDNIVDEHFSRNPRIVNGLFYWQYIEELGLGVDRMIEEMVQNGHPQPEFIATPHSFTVILKRGTGIAQRRAVPEWERGMNERQLRALQYLQQHARITNREYHEICPDVSPETLRLDLNDLTDKGLIMKIGDKKGTYYILK
jgi:ATP-dependent DNA helicase RecG